MRLTLVLALLLATIVKVVAAEPPFLVGVLENTVPTNAVAPARPSVRVVFRHTVVGWEAFPNDCVSTECLTAITAKYPSRVIWSISSTGLVLGMLTARTPATFDSYAHIGRQSLTGKNQAPTVGRPTLEYAGFLDEPSFRPLLATSGRQPPLRSRAGWKEGIPEPEDLDRVWPSFRRLIPVIDHCALAADPDVTVGAASAMPPTGRAPKKLELEIPVAWVARNGDALLKVVVRQDVFKECDGPKEYPSQLWFHRNAKGQVRPLSGQLGSQRADLVSPLDFNDLLRDGHDEVLFWAAGYNLGGYVLYYDGFRKNVQYLWAYH